LSKLLAPAGEIAAIIVEPIAGNMTSILPAPGWLEHIRMLCDEYGILMIMDEVKTGFRIARGGATEYFGVHGDLMTYAKSLANGYPLAAIGGKREVMKIIEPEGARWHLWQRCERCCSRYVGSAGENRGAKDY
jgi:glutamate-1-semialdehyde 2,1-aminomutase